MFAAKSTKGFYDSRMGYSNIPSDAVEITAEYAQELKSGESRGMVIFWGDDGFPVLQDKPVPTLAEVTLQFREAVQQHLDNAAVAAGYDDIKAAVTYADEPSIPKFQEEGKAFRAWRSKAWDYYYTQINAVESGARDIPTLEELIYELPALTLPS